jgi:hypothetical protein
LALIITGCPKETGDLQPAGKKAPVAEKKPVEKKPQDKPEAEPDPKPAEPPAAPGPEVAQCQAILDKGWEAIQPVVAKLQIEDPAALKPRYVKSARNFLQRCQALPEDMRSCLEKADHPYQAIATCEINKDKQVSERLFPPSLRSYIKLLQHELLKPKAAKKQLAQMKGKWVNDWKSAKTTTTWLIDKSGKVKETSKVRDGEPKEREFSISFEREGLMRVEWSKQSAQPFMFYKPSGKVFYATGNLVYGAYPMKNRNSFVVQNSSEYIFFEKGKCKVVSNNGLEVDGECGFAKQKKQKVFKVKYQFPGRMLMNGKPRIDQRTYFVDGKTLLHESLVTAGKFVRK